jgi:hypothetical protein
MSECARAGCSAEATHYITIAIPPTGYPIERGVVSILGLALCRDCGLATRVEDIFTDEGKRAFNATVKASVGGAAVPLDFDRAEIGLHLIGDEQWREFLARSAKLQGGGQA